MTKPINKPLEKDSIYLNVNNLDFDKAFLSVDVFSQIRNDFFKSNKKQKGKTFYTFKNERLGYAYQIDNKGNFKWKATVNGIASEEAFSETGGYRIEYKSFTGDVYKRAYFNHSHIWQKTEYLSADGTQAVCSLLPWLNDNIAAIAKYTSDSSFPEILFSLPMPTDIYELNTLLHGVSPCVSAITNKGMSYFGNEEEQRLWSKLLNNNPDTEFVKEKAIDNNTSSKKIFFKIDNSSTFDLSATKAVFPESISKNTKKQNSNNTEKSNNIADKRNAKSKSTIKKKVKDSDECVYADKIIRINTREKGLYFGSLDDNNSRSGYGRTESVKGNTLYEGEYKNDMRSGFGVSYFKTGKVAYIGNWHNDKQNGFGIEIRPNDGSVTFSNFENNIKKGISAKFDKNGKLLYVGNWYDEAAIGAGVSFNEDNGNMFISKWKDGKQLNSGTVIDKEGNVIYSGEYKNGVKEGRGVLYNSDGSILYNGSFKRDLYSGMGKLYLENGDTIDGEFSNNAVNGYAVKRNKDGKLIYDGQWKKGVYWGDGTLYYADGSHCTGKFVNGEPKGTLSIYDKNNIITYTGTMFGGKYDGSGICFENGEKVYDGQLSNNMRCGTGREYKSGQCIYMGSFDNDKYSDFGISYTDGVNKYCGMWENGLYNGAGILFQDDETIIAGNFSNGQPDGRVNIIKNGIVIKECIYNSGECEYMREYSDDGESLLYQGNVKNNTREGMGCTFTEYGEKQFEGIFKFGEPFKSMKISTKELQALEYIPKLKDTYYEKCRVSKEFVVEQPMHNGVYSGALLNGVPHGKGSILYFDHRYTGEFKNGAAIGNGEIYCGDGTVVAGEFTDKSDDTAVEIKFSSVTYYHKS